MKCGGLVLCGGRSSRMGQDKVWLPFGPETMLQRVVRLVGEAVGPVHVVCAAGSRLPELPADVRIVHDRRPDRGPLEGLASGLAAMGQVSDAGDRIQAAFVTSCDVPLLTPQFIRRMIELLGTDDIAAPHVDGRSHPLAAVYRASVLPHAERLLAADQLRLTRMLDEVPTRLVGPEELLDVDPNLGSLRNINSPEEYRAALAEVEAL